MNSNDWHNILATVAPTIATALGGPLAGMAVTTLSGVLLGKKDATMAETQAAVAGATPADLVKMREADEAFKTALANAGVQLEQIEAADRASARDREEKIGDWTPRVLATIVVAGWFAAQWWLFHMKADADMRDLLARVLGTLDSALMCVLFYYFGSSRDARQKDDTIQTIAKMP